MIDWKVVLDFQLCCIRIKCQVCSDIHIHGGQMTKNPITFTVNSCVPGYRGQLELKSNEGKDDKPFIYLRVIVDEFCLKLGREVSELK